PAIPTVDPPSQPRRAIVSVGALSLLPARFTFFDLPEVVKQISTSPGAPKAATWRAKISSKPYSLPAATSNRPSIAFAVIMTVLSLLITIVVQMVSAAFSLRRTEKDSMGQMSLPARYHGGNRATT